MILRPFRRRRAERFAQLLDEATGGRRHHTRSPYDEELASLLAVTRPHIEQMSEIADEVTADHGFRHRSRQRLLAIAQTQGIGAHGVPGGFDPGVGSLDAGHDAVLAHGPGRRARVAVAMGAVVGVLALSGVSTASGDAVPGDTLYPVKRQTERAQLALAGSDVNRGQLYLDFARTRLKEAGAMAEESATLARALDDMDDDTRKGVRLLNSAAVERRDADLFSTVEEFVVRQRPTLLDLVDELSGVSRERTVESLKLLEESAERAAALRQSLLCTGQSGISTDQLGPLPQSCSTVQAKERSADGKSTGGPASPRDVNPNSPVQERDDPTSMSPTDLLSASPSAGASEDREEPRQTPSAGLLDELGRLINDLLN